MKQLGFNQIRWAMKNIEMYFLSVWCPFHSLKGQSWGLFKKKKKNTHLSIKWPEEIQEEVDIFHERA